MNKKQLIEIATRIGYCLQTAGAETFRVEDSMYRILSALGARDISVFVINSVIMFSMKTREGQIAFDMKRCLGKGIDLYKIEKANALCRRICSEEMSYEEIIAEIEKIENKKQYSFIVKYLGFTVVSVGFTAIFGGGLLEALAAFFTALIVYPLMHFMDSLKIGIFFKNILASAAIALAVVVFNAFICQIQIDKTIIGTFMNLVPGVALTTSMRDIIAGDQISGKNILTEAIIIALGMALGAGMVMAASQGLI